MTPPEPFSMKIPVHSHRMSNPVLCTPERDQRKRTLVLVARSRRHLEDNVDEGRRLRDLPVDSGTKRAWRNAGSVELEVADGVVAACQASAGGCRGRSRGHPQVVLVDIPAGIGICSARVSGLWLGLDKGKTHR